jgi:type VI secretion system secreted protein VgrG
MTPDAGTSGEVPTNRGFVFIPEVGDNVMLGFHHNNPNQPFVLGSLFNGQTGTGGGEENHLKSIFMRGGSTITFNELEKSILIKDPSGNTWFMDGAGNISVSAPKTFSVEATDIIMTALKSVSVTAGASITETAGIDHSISAGAMMSQMAGEIIL